MMLPRGLKRGAWLELDEGDIRALVQAAAAGRPDADLADVMNEVTAGAAMRGVTNACAEPFGLPVLVNRG
jgi:hypothetical protein